MQSEHAATATIDGIRGVVVDIEGTTSATSAVHVGLYGYARPRLASWLHAHADDPEIAAAIEATRRDAGLVAGATLDDVASALEAWMDGDIKATPLKTVQGQIWAAGFEDGQLTSHVFDDVPPALQGWVENEIHLAVFSSGSVASQRPWFRHSNHGDLSPLFEAYFDTVNAGPKREPIAYDRIADELTGRWSCTVSELLFLSDVPAELDAAAQAGWLTVGLRRNGEPYGEA
ncbi:MAG: acireductone synthase, partial [Ilumatobacteraceae bacterium]